MVKNLPTMRENLGFIPRLGRFPGEGNGYPLQYACLENSMDRRAWQGTVHGVAKSRMRPSDFHFRMNNHIVFIHSSVGGRLSCFHFWLLLIMLLGTFMYKLLHGHVFLFLLSIYLEIELLALTIHDWATELNWTEPNHHIWGTAKLFSKAAAPLFPPAMYGFQFLHILVNTWYCLSFWHSHPSGCGVASYCSLAFRFLMNNDVEHLSMC